MDKPLVSRTMVGKYSRQILVDEDTLREALKDRQWWRYPHVTSSDLLCGKCKAIDRLKDLGYLGEKL